MTNLDSHTAVLIIDLHKGIVAYPTVHPIKQALAHAGDLAVAFCRHRLTDASATVRANSVERITPRLGETGTSAEVIARCSTVAGHDFALFWRCSSRCEARVRPDVRLSDDGKSRVPLLVSPRLNFS